MKGNAPKKIKAQQRIKKHIRKRGEACDFELTPEFALYWWHQLNNAIFDNQLKPPVRFVIRNFRDCVGWCKPLKRNSNVVVGLYREMWDRKYFLTILVHEMVHSYEYQEHGYMSHGDNFYKWAPKIKRTIGLQLSEFVD